MHKGEPADFAPLTDDDLSALETTVKKMIGTNLPLTTLTPVEKDLLLRWMVEVRRVRAREGELAPKPPRPQRDRKGREQP